MDGVVTKVGVIGLGAMGSALADALIFKGFNVTVWNRTSAKAQRFAKAGAKIATSPTDVARTVDVLVVNLFDENAVKDAVLTNDVGAALRGKTYVELTSYADGLETLKGWCANHGVALLKGDILVYPDAIRAGSGAVCYAGIKRDFDATLPVLKAMGGQPIYTAIDTSIQQMVVSAYYCFVFPGLLGFILGASMLHRAGVPVAPLAEQLILRGTQGAPWHSLFANTANAIATRRYDDNVQATIETWYDGLKGSIAWHESKGHEISLHHAVKVMLDRAIAAGYSQRDIAAVFETLINNTRS